MCMCVSVYGSSTGSDLTTTTLLFSALQQLDATFGSLPTRQQRDYLQTKNIEKMLSAIMR